MLNPQTKAILLAVISLAVKRVFCIIMNCSKSKDRLFVLSLTYNNKSQKGMRKLANMTIVYKLLHTSLIIWPVISKDL